MSTRTFSLRGNWVRLAISFLSIIPLALALFFMRMILAFLMIPLESFLDEDTIVVLFLLLSVAVMIAPLVYGWRKKVSFVYLGAYILACVLSLGFGPME